IIQTDIESMFSNFCHILRNMILFILGFLILLVDIFAIKDITSSRLDSLKKTLWILFVLIVPVLGMSFYYFSKSFYSSKKDLV
ncbi:MAG TPA: PLD nuclease N-terminal domain-containing protein, partial [Bacteroidaceae bacterium]|nr:PLD nuclease N-terminal domain-containing protein [Bacteroidaceae bacterium]